MTDTTTDLTLTDSTKRRRMVEGLNKLHGDFILEGNTKAAKAVSTALTELSSASLIRLYDAIQRQP